MKKIKPKNRAELRELVKDNGKKVLQRYSSEQKKSGKKSALATRIPQEF